MPIKGLTDSPMLMPRLGKLHLGVRVKGQGKSEYPRATKYFVYEDNEAGRALREHLGLDEPKELKIVFPTDDENQFAPHYYRAYSSYRGLVCRGTGETAWRMVDLKKVVDPKTGEITPRDRRPQSWPLAGRGTEEVAYFDIECPGKACPDYQRKACRAVMNLQFMLPRFPLLGVWQIDTSSYYGMRNILKCVRMVKSTLNGRIALVPLRLVLRQQEVQPEGVKKTVTVMDLVVPYSLESLVKSVSELPGAERVALPEPDLEVPGDLFTSDEGGTTEGFPPVGQPEGAQVEPPPDQAPPPQEVETPAEQPEPKREPRRRQRPTTTPTRRTPDESPELQKAWERVQEKVGQASDQGRSNVFRWLAMTTGKEIPANLFGLESVPPLIPTRLIYQLEADFEQITSGKPGRLV